MSSINRTIILSLGYLTSYGLSSLSFMGFGSIATTVYVYLLTHLTNFGSPIHL
jgi:hypothetical protein